LTHIDPPRIGEATQEGPPPMAALTRLPGRERHEHEFLQVLVARLLQLGGRPLETDLPLVEHHEVSLSGGVLGKRQDAMAITLAHGPVRRDMERVSNLVRDDDRRDVLEVSQLDDLVLDARRPYRVDARRP